MNAVLFAGDMKLLNAVATLVAGHCAVGEASPASSAQPILVADELAILAMVQRGCTSREIAQQLGLSVVTVKLRLTAMYRRVGRRLR